MRSLRLRGENAFILLFRVIPCSSVANAFSLLTVANASGSDFPCSSVANASSLLTVANASGSDFPCSSVANASSLLAVAHASGSDFILLLCSPALTLVLAPSV